jgi:hypothetical protein
MNQPAFTIPFQMITQPWKKPTLVRDHPGFGVGFPDILDALRFAAFDCVATAIPKTRIRVEFPPRDSSAFQFLSAFRSPLAEELAHEFLDGLHTLY